MLIEWIHCALVSALPTLDEDDTEPSELIDDNARFPENNPESLGATENSGFSLFHSRMQHYSYNTEGDVELCYDTVDEGLDILIRDDPSSTGQSNNIHSVSIHAFSGSTKLANC